MKFDLKICFETSKSKSCEEVTKIASKIDTFTAGKPNIVIFNERNITEHADRLFDMVTFFGRMKTNTYFLNGKEITRDKVRAILLPLQCYESYKEAVIPLLHCNVTKALPGWGCKLFSHVMRYLSYDHYSPYHSPYCEDTIYWYEAGKFTSENIWHIDKKELQAYLRKEADNKYLELCPVFNFKNVIAEIKSLPDRIDLTDNADWEKAYYQEAGESQKVIGIQPKEKSYTDAENEENSTDSSGGGLVLRVPDDIPLDDLLPDNPDEEDEPL